jgi:hypothetical protein
MQLLLIRTAKLLKLPQELSRRREAMQRLSQIATAGAIATLSSLAIATTASAQNTAPVEVNFKTLGAGQTVEGLGTVHELLNITSSTGNAKVLLPGASSGTYGATEYDDNTNKPNSGLRNGGIDEVLGGFADFDKAHIFEFSFAEGTTVDAFSLRMLDYGDYNPGGATEHNIFLTALNSAGEQVDRFELSYESDKRVNPCGFYTCKDVYGNVGLGDATWASAGDPGLATLSVFGSGIARVLLTYENNGSRDGMASDPNIGFDTLAFNVEPEDVPEPTAVLGLLAVSGAGILARRR